MSSSYLDFINVNNTLKTNLKNNPFVNQGLTIEDVSFSEEKVRFTNGSVCRIDELVNAVLKGQGYVTNPSLLTKWKGFKKHSYYFVVRKDGSNDIIAPNNMRKSVVFENKEDCVIAVLNFIFSDKDNLRIGRGLNHNFSEEIRLKLLEQAVSGSCYQSFNAIDNSWHIDLEITKKEAKGEITVKEVKKGFFNKGSYDYRNYFFNIYIQEVE